MRLFALDTNINNVKEKFLTKDEKELLMVRPHVFSFLWHVLAEIFLTILLLTGAVLAVSYGILSVPVATGVFLVGWFAFVFLGLLRAYIDWKHDFLLLTNEKIVIVDQMSLFRKSITPISLENLGNVTSETQWLNLFGFGIIRLTPAEGNAPEVVLRFMPNADRLVIRIAEQLTFFDRRREFKSFPPSHHAAQ